MAKTDRSIIIESSKEELSKKDKIELELQRQGLLYSYWRDAEKTNYTVIGFFTISIIIPFLLKTTLDWSNWNSWGLVIALIIFIVSFIIKDHKYNKKQKIFREKIESITI